MISYENLEKYEKFKTIIKNKKFFTIDGIIGGGKTYLGEKLQTYFNTENKIKTLFIPEPVNVWEESGAFKRFYNDISNNCYEFQTFTYITRIQAVIDAVLNNPDVDLYILERSIFTDKYIFVELLKEELGETRLKMYNMWWDMWSIIFSVKIDKWIFIDTSVDISINRIKKRNRNNEKVDETYLSNLRDVHIKFFDKLIEEKENVSVVPSSIMNQDFNNHAELITNIAQMIS